MSPEKNVRSTVKRFMNPEFFMSESEQKRDEEVFRYSNPSSFGSTLTFSSFHFIIILAIIIDGKGCYFSANKFWIVA